MGKNLNSEGVQLYNEERYAEAIVKFLVSLPYDDSAGHILANLSNSYYQLVKLGDMTCVSELILYSKRGEEKKNATCTINLAMTYDPGLENHVPAQYKSYEQAALYYKRYIEYAGKENAVSAAYGNLAYDAYCLVTHGRGDYLSDAVFYSELAVERHHNRYAAFRLGLIYDPNLNNGVPQCYKDEDKALCYYQLHINYSESGSEWSNAYNNMGIIYGKQKQNTYLEACLCKIAFQCDSNNVTARKNYAACENSLTAYDTDMIEAVDSLEDIRELLNTYSRDCSVGSFTEHVHEEEPPFHDDGLTAEERLLRSIFGDTYIS